MLGDVILSLEQLRDRLETVSSTVVPEKDQDDGLGRGQPFQIHGVAVGVDGFQAWREVLHLLDQRSSARISPTR